MDSVKETVITKVLAAIANSGLTQRQWCADHGIPYGGFRRMLSADISGISSGSIIRLANALSVAPWYLIQPGGE